MSIKNLTQLFSEYVDQHIAVKPPVNLYEPMQYTLNLGGKRLRPVLALLSAKGYGINPKEVLPAALSIEVFHNFTLLHDDIMDKASIRRGEPTVYKKWNENTAILSGDMMLIKAYQYLEAYDPQLFHPITKVLSQTALEVCEGQQYDMDFETENHVTIGRYMEMIRLKTAVLLGASLKIGAIVAKVDRQQQDLIYDMGVKLGLVFQLQDDYLDSFGDESTFGKQIGGDIMEHKKTWLHIKTLELSDGQARERLNNLKEYQGDRKSKIDQVLEIYKKCKVDDFIKLEIKNYSDQSEKILEQLKLTDEVKSDLHQLIQKLKIRNN